MNISQAAEKLNVSVRTVRRYIKAGKLKAEMVTGQFGEEYRIFKIPAELLPLEEIEKETKNTASTPEQSTGHSLVQAVDIIRELQEKNLALAAQLGAASERIRNLEGQVKLLSVAKQPWWKRVATRIGSISNNNKNGD